MYYFKAIGIVAATSIAGAVQTILFLWFLRRKFNFSIYLKRFLIFACHFAIQLFCVSLIFYLAYQGILDTIKRLPEFYVVFFTTQIGLWFWVGPLSLLMMGTLWTTRKLFNIKIYYFD
jgi:peptidoglycan biosynthesis protein MviN/MurJ (putative lipid II flippase)